MSNDEKCCLNCKIFWDKEYGCEECRFEHKDHPSLFYKITASPEMLAPKFIGLIFDHRFTSKYRYYSMLTGDFYNSESEAFAATVAKLKEVEK